MADVPKRPTFSDATPVEALPPDPGPQPNLPGPDDALAELGELTGEQRAMLAGGLFTPTVKRMVILMTHVVRMTQNADLVLWLAMAALDGMLRDLRWEAAVPGSADKFLALVITALREYTDRLQVHQSEWAVWEADGRKGPQPVLSPWTDADALQIYARVDFMFPNTQRPINRETLRDMLLMVIDETDLPGSGLDIDRATKEEIVAADTSLMNIINGWTDEECRDAEAWAVNVHLRASDNDDLAVVERPRFIGARKFPPAP